MVESFVISLDAGMLATAVGKESEALAATHTFSLAVFHSSHPCWAVTVTVHWLVLVFSLGFLDCTYWKFS